MWRRPEPPPLDRETVDGIVGKLLAIDVELALLLEHFGMRDKETDDDDA